MSRSPDASTEALVDALHRRGVAEVDVSTRRRAEYSSDASLYRVVPQAVVFPRHVDELPAVLDACREVGVPLVARGAGTSVAGNAVGTGVVLDSSRHLNRVLAVDPDARTATVEPGVILDDLQRVAAPHTLRFGPDPSTHNRCTLGGMIGNNACGSRALGYGRTSDNVVALDVVTGTGERLRASRETPTEGSATFRRLREAVAADLQVVRTELGQFSRQVSGYALEHLLPENGFDLARALVGSEGTWALTLAATLRLAPVPASTTLLVLGYPDMAAAADAVPALLPLSPLAVEGLDSRIVDVVRQRRGDASVPPLPRGDGWLFVELPGDTGTALDAAARSADAVDARVVTDAGEAATLWRIREDGAGLASRPTGGRVAHPGWEDAAVPPHQLGAYLRDFDALLVQHGLMGIPYGHFGDGCVHVRIDFPLRRSGGTGVFRQFLLDAATLVARYGGSISGEHGDGRARSELLPFMYSAAAIAAFERVKAVFDPDDLLNPGVLVRPRPLDADLRAPHAAPLRRGLGFAFHDDGGDFAAAVHRCSGVGKCRANGTGVGDVMCPSYLATHDEKDSTRGRARVLQELVSGVNGTLFDGWRAPEVREVLDLCLACKGCAADCPTGTDMATYKAQVLHQAYRRRIRPRSHYTLGWLPRWAALASRAPTAANALLRSPLAPAAKWAAGVDGRRDVPPFATRTFRDWFAGRPPPSSGDPVLLWVDSFTDVFSPDVGIAAVRVLEDAGFAVRIPERRLCCGLTWITTGQLDGARRQLRRSVRALAPGVAAGLPVVGLEPSCTAVLRAEAPELLPDDDAAGLVAGSVRTLAEVLRDRPGWQPPDLTGTKVVAQPHCHHHAVMGWQPDEELLTRAGAQVQRLGGCCGLAGNFGVERGHYEVSLAVAETALLPAVRAADPAAVVLADGFSCRTQLAALSDRSGVHLAQLLAAPTR